MVTFGHRNENMTSKINLFGEDISCYTERFLSNRFSISPFANFAT